MKQISDLKSISQFQSQLRLSELEYVGNGIINSPKNWGYLRKKIYFSEITDFSKVSVHYSKLSLVPDAVIKKLSITVGDFTFDCVNQTIPRDEPKPIDLGIYTILEDEKGPVEFLAVIKTLNVSTSHFDILKQLITASQENFNDKTIIEIKSDDVSYLVLYKYINALSPDMLFPIWITESGFEHIAQAKGICLMPKIYLTNEPDDGVYALGCEIVGVDSLMLVLIDNENHDSHDLASHQESQVSCSNVIVTTAQVHASEESEPDLNNGEKAILPSDGDKISKNLSKQTVQRPLEVLPSTCSVHSRLYELDLLLSHYQNITDTQLKSAMKKRLLHLLER